LLCLRESVRQHRHTNRQPHNQESQAHPHHPPPGNHEHVFDFVRFQNFKLELALELELNRAAVTIF
jgi:hypothetical protein